MKDFAVAMGVVSAVIIGVGVDTYLESEAYKTWQRGIVLSEMYDEKLDSYVAKISHNGQTNSFIIVEHAARPRKIKDLANTLEAGDEILFRYCSLNPESKTGYAYAHQVRKAQK